LLLAVVAALLLAACASRSEAQLSQAALAKGLAAQAHGKLLDAGRFYREAIYHDPSNKWAYFDLGVVDETQHQPSEAELDYRQALLIDPDLAPALYNLAIVLTDTNPSEAEALYRHLLAIEPKNGAAHWNLAVILKRSGRLSEAHAQFQTARQDEPRLANAPEPSS
jgi:tetratricopeptide (TPR) repeat protein